MPNPRRRAWSPLRWACVAVVALCAAAAALFTFGLVGTGGACGVNVCGPVILQAIGTGAAFVYLARLA